MDSVALSRDELKSKGRRVPVSRLRSRLALTILWMINLLIILFGWPFLLYGKLKYRKEQPEGPLD